MTIFFRSLTIWVDVACGVLNVCLDAWHGDRQIPDQRPSPPATPTVPSMPAQRPRDSHGLFVISEAERFALVRAKVALEMGIQPAPEVLHLIAAMHERAARLELEEHAEDFELWTAEVKGQ